MGICNSQNSIQKQNLNHKNINNQHNITFKNESRMVEENFIK